MQSTLYLSAVLNFVALSTAVLAIYGKDLSQIFERSLEFGAGNISNYILALPFLMFYVIYRKRKKIGFILLHHETSIIPTKNEIAGIAICGIAVAIFLYGPSIYALEYHVLSLVMFSVGATLLLFGFKILRQVSFALVLLCFFVPIPLEFINFFVTLFNPITAHIVQMMLNVSGIISTLDVVGIPQIAVTNPGGMAHTFLIGQPSSGLYSMVILSSVGLFIAYLVSGPVWKRIVLWLLGFPVMFFLNAIRISLIIIIWNHFDMDISEIFHAVSGSVMIAFDALLLLVVGRRILGISIEPNQKTNHDKSTADTIHTFKNVILDNAKKITILAVLVIFASSQTNMISSDTGQSIEITALDGSTALELFPQLDGWNLEYAYRNYPLEQTLRHDLFVFARYVSEGTVDNTPEIHTAIDIGDYPHRLESSLTLPGRQSSVILTQEDVAISDSMGRFLAYQEDSKNVVVLYWIKEIPIHVESGISEKYVEFIVTSNMGYLASHGLINGITDFDGAREILTGFANPINSHWSKDISFAESGDKILLYGLDSKIIQSDFLLNDIIPESDDIDHLIKRADTLYHVEYNYVESLKTYRQVIQTQPSNIVALNGVGHSLVKLHQNVEAIDYFDDVLSIDDNNTDARIGIGNALYNMDKPDEAIYHYTQALQQGPNLDAMIGMAASTFDLGKYDETVSWVEKILQIESDNPSAISLQINLQSKSITQPEINLATTKLSGIAYSPYRAGQSPMNGPHPSVEEIEDDIRFLSSVTNTLRVYGLDGNNQFVPEIAQKYGVKVAVTLLLNGNESSDQTKIERGINLANEYPDTIYTLIVENEGLYRKTLSEEQIIKYIVDIKEKLNPECTITLAEPSFVWLQHPKIAQYVDYAMIHYHPYWGGFEIDDAVGKVFDAYYEVRDTFGKDVVIGETGWPSDGRNVSQAVPSAENQEKFVMEFREIADIRNIKYFMFEAFDEKWKLEEEFDSGGPNDAENHWGLFYENGILKESLSNVMPPSQHDTTR